MINYGKTYNKQVPVLISDKSIFCEGGGRLLSDIIYPVGSIYISVNSTNPSVYFGGSWEQIQGRFLVGCGSNGVDLYTTAGQIGGSVSHYILTENLPWQVTVRLNLSSGWGNNNWGSLSGWGNYQNDSGGRQVGQSINHLPPFLSVYIWKRTG